MAQLPALTGIRALAALWVVSFHFTRFDAHLYNAGFLNPIVRHGYLGVDLFFVLSGFIMTHVYRGQFRSRFSASSWCDFLQNRLARLYPIHLVTALAMVAVAITGRRYGFVPLKASFSPLSLLANITLTQAWFCGVASMNSVAWSISAEWFAYLLFPMVYFLLWKPGDGWPWVVAPLALGGCLFVGQASPLLRISAEFPLGMAVYELQTRLPRPLFGRVGGLLGVVALIVTAYCLHDTHYFFGMALASALLLTALVNPSDLLGWLLSTKAMIYLGEISYSIYMCHWVVWTVLRRGLSVVLEVKVVPRLWIMLVALSVTLAISSLLYHVIELPGRRAIRDLRWRGAW